MKLNRKIILSIFLLIAFLIPTITSQSAVAASGITVQDGQNAITITTNYMTMKILDDKPHFLWWNGNQSSADENYNVIISNIAEYSGDDDVLNHQSELFGVSYNLLTIDWSTDIVEGDDSITVTLTSIGLANGVEIKFILNAYSEDQAIAGTDQIIEALTEIKFDIIVDNWQFSPSAKGLAIKTQTLESQQRHTMRIRNGTVNENGNATRTMQFESQEHGNSKVAYFEWATFANVYNDSLLEETIEVGNAFFAPEEHGMGPGTHGMMEMYLTYPNYGDSLKLVHDPSVGIYPEAFSVPIPISPIIGGFIATVAIITIIKKRK